MPAPHAAVEMRSVHKRFGALELLRGVDLTVPTGARLGIIGPAASGKSVLLKLISRLIDPDDGSIHIDGRDITALTENELMSVRARIGMLFQNYALFDFMTVGDNVAFPLVRRGELEDDEIRDRVLKRLRLVGLAGTEDRMPSELSGGMKKRVGIARATIASPEIAVYDEPTAGLDPVTTSKIYDLIRADQDRTGCTVIAVSSDVVGLTSFVDDIAMIYDGAIRYSGRADAIASSDDELVRQFVTGALEGPLP